MAIETKAEIIAKRAARLLTALDSEGYQLCVQTRRELAAALALPADEETQAPGVELDAPMPARRDRKPAPLVKFMLTDASLEWVQYQAGVKDDGRKAFKDFHGHAPRAGFRLFMCHPDTAWDGAGGYSIPAGEWAPIQVL